MDYVHVRFHCISDSHPGDDLDAESTSDAEFVDIATEKDKLHVRSKKTSLEKDKKENNKSGKKTKKKKAV